MPISEPSLGKQASYTTTYRQEWKAAGFGYMTAMIFEDDREIAKAIFDVWRAERLVYMAEKHSDNEEGMEILASRNLPQRIANSAVEKIKNTAYSKQYRATADRRIEQLENALKCYDANRNYFLAAEVGHRKNVYAARAMAYVSLARATHKFLVALRVLGSEYSPVADGKYSL